MRKLCLRGVACLLALLLAVTLLPLSLMVGAAATRITLKPSFVELWVNFGAECKLAVTVEGEYPEQPLIWVSSDPAVATAEGGNIVPLSVGVTYVSAMATDGSGAVSGAVKVNVLPDQTPAPDQLITLGSVSTGMATVKQRLAWPTAYGDAIIAQWWDNRTAVLTLTCDDSITYDFHHWNRFLEQYGVPVTLFVATSRYDTSASGARYTDFWQQEILLGVEMQSHTDGHHSDEVYQAMSSAQIWMDFYGSVAKLEEHIDTTSRVIGYSYGWNNATYSSKAFIAGRGTTGLLNRATSINYNSLSSYSGGLANIPARVQQITNPNDTYYAGWYSIHMHQFDKNESSTGSAAYLESMIQSTILPAMEAGELWAATFAEAAMYAQERDSATLQKLTVAPDLISFELSDLMNDRLFNYPLSVKIRVDESWEYVYATQDGQPIRCEILQREDGTYLMVDAVPDRGTVHLFRSPIEVPPPSPPDYGTPGEAGDHTMSAVAAGAALPAEGDRITISSPDEWVDFVHWVGKGNTGAGLTFVLTCSMDLSVLQRQDPVGTALHPFSGHFDGQGHTLSGVSIKRISWHIGVFGYVTSGSITGLHVEGELQGGDHVGGIVGYALSTPLSDCSFSGSVTNLGSAAGGIAGVYTSNEGTEIRRCVNFGTVEAVDYAGGIVGKGSPIGKNDDRLRIYDCANYGDVTASGNYAGGIIGDMFSNSSGRVIYVRNCLNAGHITGASLVGGIAGRMGGNRFASAANTLSVGQVTCSASPASYTAAVVGNLLKGNQDPVPSYLYYLTTANPGLPGFYTETGATGTFFGIDEGQLNGTSSSLIGTEYAAYASVANALNAWVDAQGSAGHAQWQVVTVGDLSLPSPAALVRNPSDHWYVPPTDPIDREQVRADFLAQVSVPGTEIAAHFAAMSEALALLEWVDVSSSESVFSAVRQLLADMTHWNEMASDTRVLQAGLTAAVQAPLLPSAGWAAWLADCLRGEQEEEVQ
ncbi:MAG: polysaccharide deacetylase family protein [Eubacteriales bacterium]